MFVENPTDQGVSEVVGYILIIGFSLVLSVSIIIGFQGYIGTVSEATADTNEQRSIINFNESIITTLQQESPTSNPVQLQSEDPIRVEKSTMQLQRTSGGTQTTIFNKTYDSLIYETESNHLVVENGGVWNIQNDPSVLLSKPLLEYNSDGLFLSVINSSSSSLINSGYKSITQNSTQLLRTNEPQTDNTYTLIIESPLYQEWGEYMETRYNTGVQTTYEDAESTVEIQLNPSKIYKESTDSAIDSTGTVTVTSNSSVNGSITTTNSIKGKDSISGDILEDSFTDFYQIDENVETRLSSIQSNSPTESSPGDGTVTAGEYYVEGDLSLSDATYDTSSGNIVVGVTGDLTVSPGSNISIDGESGSVKFFVRDDILLETPSDRSVINEDSDGSRLSLFSAGDTVRLTNIDYTGIIYNSPENTAPSLRDTSQGSLCSQYQSCIDSSSVSGSIITGNLYVTNSSNISYDTTVTSVPFTFNGSGTEESFNSVLTEYDIDY